MTFFVFDFVNMIRPWYHISYKIASALNRAIIKEKALKHLKI